LFGEKVRIEADGHKKTRSSSWIGLTKVLLVRLLLIDLFKSPVFIG